ncbi:MAG TPA: O-antigen ligase family protein, partial [Kofleriaceae bacterium]
MTAFGLAMHARQRSWMRALWIGIVLACGVTTVASQSRGATFALITGALVTGGTLLAQKLFGDTRKRSRQTFLTTSLPIGVVVACAIIVIVYASAGGVSSQLGRTTLDEASRPTSKVAIWRSTVKLATEAPILGVGRGAFEPAFTRVHGMAANYSFSHVENEYLQVVVEWGVIGMLVLGFCGVWLTLIAFKRWRDGPLVAGALGAVAAVALQSIVDFGIELLGVAIPTTIVLATLTYVPLREEQGKPLRIARVLRMALAVIVFAVGIALLTPATRTIADDHDMLAERDLTLDEVRESVARHPLDYYGYARGAQVLRSAGDPRAVQLLNHALQLHPTQPGLHHMAADMLYRAHRLDQSALEYAAALRATATRAALLAEIVKRFTPALVVRAIPSDLEPLSEIVRWLTDLGALDIAIEWLDAVLQEHPRNRNACEQLFTIIVNKHVLRAAEIASRRCTDISHEARIMIGHMLMDKQRFDEARSMLGDVEDWPGHIDTKAEGWLIVCDTLEAQKKWDEAKRCLRRLDSSGNVLDQRRGEILMRLDRITESLREQELPKP